MILTVREMKSLEEKAFEEGVVADVLMEEAGAQIACAVRQFFPTSGVCVAVFGKGNNGGDALVAARHLADAGWEVLLIPAFSDDEWSPTVRRKFTDAAGCHRRTVLALEHTTGRPLVVRPPSAPGRSDSENAAQPRPAGFSRIDGTSSKTKGPPKLL